MKKIIFFLSILLILTSKLSSQDIFYLFDYSTGTYPNISARYLLINKAGIPDYSQIKEDFLITRNELKINTVNPPICQNPQITESISYIITFDLALNKSLSGTDNFVLGKSLVNNLIKNIDTSKSEVALTSYNYLNYFNREFTNSRQELYQEVNYWQKADGSMFNAGFLNNPANPINISIPAKYKRAIVFITDGSGNVNDEEIIAQAKSVGVRIIIVEIGRKISAKMKRIAEETDGFWIDNVNEKHNTADIANLIIAFAKGYKPCTISWTQDFTCEDFHDISISLPGKSVKQNFSYKTKNDAKPMITSSLPFLAFSSVLPGKKKTITTTIVAKNADIHIDSIALKNKHFKIVKGNVKDYWLLKDKFIEIDIEYSPTDPPKLTFDELKVYSNACITEPIYMTGGFPNIQILPEEKTIDIIAPNGGDKLIVGDTFYIRWKGVLPQDLVQINLIKKKGNVYDTTIVVTNQGNLEYKWIVPDLDCDSAWIRIFQMWPNNLGITTDLVHQGKVNSAQVSKSGDLIVTTSDDSTAVIWDAKTAEKKLVLKTNSHANWAEFDLTDSFIVVASEDSTVTIFDITGAIIKEIKGKLHIVRTAIFSADGKYLAACDNTGKIIVWNTTNWDEEKEINYKPNLSSWFIAFHPQNSEIIAAVYNDGTARLWNWKNFNSGDEPIKSFLSAGEGSGTNLHVAFNTDGSKISISTGSKQPRHVYVWDNSTSNAINTAQDTLYTVLHEENTNMIFSSFYFHIEKNKEILLSGGGDATARSWNAADGKPEPLNDYTTDNSLREHTDMVTTAVFGKYGSTVVTSSWDNTAKIWNIKQFELQADKSDSAFFFVKPKIEMKNVDFDRVVVNNLVDSVVKGLIINNSGFPVQVKNMEFSGNITDFFINDDYETQFELETNDTLTYEMRFNPTVVGQRQAEIKIDVPANTFRDTLTSLGIERGLYANQLLYEFGTVDIGDNKDTLITAVVTNKTNSLINITGLRIIGSYQNEFTFVKGNDIKFLQPNEDLQMILRFSPETIGRKNAQILFEHDGIGSPTLVNLFGAGEIAVNDSLTIYINDISGEPGETVKLNFYIKNLTERGIKSNVEGFYTYLNFNSTLLQPLSNYEESTIKGDNHRLLLKLPAQFGNDSLLASFDFKVGLGNDSISKLTLEQTVPIGFWKVRVYEESANFTLKGLCNEGGPRLYDQDGILDLAQNIPNPAINSTKISFEIIESGITQLYILDMLGFKVKEIINAQLAKGKYAFEINLNDLPSGIYSYILKTPTKTLIKSMNVTK